MAPGFPIPPNTDYKGYHNYIDECIPPETPYLYGLHPNAEIEFLTSTSDNMFRVVFEMQPRDTGAGAAGGVSREEKVTIVPYGKAVFVRISDEYAANILRTALFTVIVHYIYSLLVANTQRTKLV